MNIKITIITATFNSDDTLEQTIVSVLNQNYKDIEYILVDGNSTDSTVDIIKKYCAKDKRIRWISENDSGLYNALNKGVNMATGDYIEIIGSDDALASSTVISSVVNDIRPDTDILSGLIYAVDEKNHKQYIICDNHIARDKKKYYGGMIGHAGMFVRRSLLKKYPFDETYKIAADYKFFLQCYYDSTVRFKFVDTVIAFFSNNGLSSNENECLIENNRIYKELNYPFNSVASNNAAPFKKRLKFILSKTSLGNKVIALYSLIINTYHTHFKWEKHHCDNPICRWCGRYEE